MRKVTLFLCCTLVLVATTYAQKLEKEQEEIQELKQQNQEQATELKKLNQFKISGYIQTQFQYGQKDASLKVGNKNTNFDKGYNRFGIRRGRVKLEYKRHIFSGVFQLDITEKGLGLKDAYISIQDPWVGSSSIKAGVFNRPFGYEISYSSSKRESPERATVITTLFPEERDLGAMLTLQAPKESPWSILKLDAAIVSGNGIKLDLDNQKDFIGRLSLNKDFNKKFSIGGGVSYYKGKVYQGSPNIYKMSGQSFITTSDSTQINTYTKREYFGVDLQLTLNSKIGQTHVYGEYIMGTQPGTKTSSKSPNSTTLPTSDTYIRSFSGYYITWVQGLGKLPLSLVAKYDSYNPNKYISKDEIGLNGSGKGDIAYQTLGGGILWQAHKNLRLSAYYDWIVNEKSQNLNGFESDIADNVFTLRLQYKF